jgi:hypothetical protein
MSNGSDEWSPLSTARTVSSGKICNDEDKDGDIFMTTRAPQIEREIVRKTVEDRENALCGIGSIYNIGKILGQGSFATVKEATHKLTGSVVAIKIIEKLDSDNFEEQEVVFELCSLYDQNAHAQIGHGVVLHFLSDLCFGSNQSS